METHGSGALPYNQEQKGDDDSLQGMDNNSVLWEVGSAKGNVYNDIQIL